MSRTTIATGVLLAVVGLLVLYPLFMLLWGSLHGGPPGEPSPFTLRGYAAAYSHRETYSALGTTLWLGAVRTLLAAALGIFLAWVITRTDTPWRPGLEALVWLQVLIPLLPLTMAWSLLASPQAGLLNLAFLKLFPGSSPPFNIYSYGGIIWVSVFQWAAIIFLLVTPAFRGMEATLEEASRVSGASARTTLVRITLPLLAPALLGALVLAFLKLMESFEVEFLLGLSQGITVYTTRIWLLLRIVPADYPQGLALSFLFLLPLLGLVFLYWRLFGRARPVGYVTIGGRGFAPRPTPLGRWRYLTLGLVLAYVLVSTIVPLLALALGSFMKLFGVFLAEPFTLGHWQGIFGDPRLWPSLGNTLVVALVSAVAGMLLYVFVSYVVTRTRSRGRAALEFISWLPWAIPGMVMALGFLWAYVGGIPLPFSLYGTIYLMMLVFVVQGLPLGVRVMNGAMVQLGPELEEASRVLGGSWLQTFRRIVAPLLRPAFLSVGIILYVLVVRDLVTVVLLYGANSRLLSILVFENWWGNQPGQAAALSLVLVGVSLLVVLAARRLGTRDQRG